MGLRLFFLPNFPGAMFIQGATLIPDSRVCFKPKAQLLCKTRLKWLPNAKFTYFFPLIDLSIKKSKVLLTDDFGKHFEIDDVQKVLKKIQVMSLVFRNFVFKFVLFCFLFKAKEWSLVFIYQILDSTDFSKNQLKTWHFLVF